MRIAMLEEEKSHSTVKRGSENRPTVLGRGRAIWSLGRTHFISPQSFLEVLPPLSKPSYEKPQESEATPAESSPHLHPNYSSGIAEAVRLGNPD